MSLEGFEETLAQLDDGDGDTWGAATGARYFLSEARERGLERRGRIVVTVRRGRIRRDRRQIEIVVRRDFLVSGQFD